MAIILNIMMIGKGISKLFIPRLKYCIWTMMRAQHEKTFPRLTMSQTLSYARISKFTEVRPKRRLSPLRIFKRSYSSSCRNHWNIFGHKKFWRIWCGWKIIFQESIETGGQKRTRNRFSSKTLSKWYYSRFVVNIS